MKKIIELNESLFTHLLLTEFYNKASNSPIEKKKNPIFLLFPIFLSFLHF